MTARLKLPTLAIKGFHFKAGGKKSSYSPTVSCSLILGNTTDERKERSRGKRGELNCTVQGFTAQHCTALYYCTLIFSLASSIYIQSPAG